MKIRELGKANAMRVLVVDDDHGVVEEVVRGLRLAGFDAVGCSSPSGAGTEAHQHRYDFILLDVHMPEYSGSRVLLDLAVSAPDAKVIMMSARNDVAEILDAIGHGAVDFLEKPFDVDAVVNRITVNQRRPRFELAPALMREHLIESLWANIQLEVGNVRGRRLEQLLYHIFASVPFFRDVRTNLRGDVDEIDVEAVNDGESNFWRGVGGLVVAECKNWRGSGRSVGIQECDHFAASLLRSAVYKVGFFVSLSGFSPEFHNARSRVLESGRIIVPVDEYSGPRISDQAIS